MMRLPENSRLFTRWVNPANGVESYILTERPAPVQQTFYYTHPSFTEDGRYLWLGCGYPPEGGMHAQQVLGVVDFEKDEIRVYPETQFPSSRPWVDLKTGEAYWANQLEVWKRGPGANDKPVLVNRFPTELATGRLDKIGTHPTFSADGKYISIDARFHQANGPTVCYLGDLPLDGGPFRLWQKFEERYHNHALFSPTDSDVQLFAHEHWLENPAPFDEKELYDRMWLIRRGEKAEPVLRAPVSHSGHEWWDADGKHVWYVHYGVGIKKVDLATREETMVWPGSLSHGHTDQSSRYLVADRMEHPSPADCHVVFRDTQTGREVEIVNRPPLAPNLTQCIHLHPHPQFCSGDRYICHTTIVHDRVDVALVPVEPLKERTR